MPDPASLSGAGYDALLVLGGAMGAADDDVAPWLPAVRALLAEAVRTELPTLGVCLGGQLLALANIDADLCQKVADALGLPAPEPTIPLTDETPSPALSQIGGTWPVDGRLVGSSGDDDTDGEVVGGYTAQLGEGCPEYVEP